MMFSRTPMSWLKSSTVKKCLSTGSDTMFFSSFLLMPSVTPIPVGMVEYVAIADAASNKYAIICRHLDNVGDRRNILS